MSKVKWAAVVVLAAWHCRMATAQGSPDGDEAGGDGPETITAPPVTLPKYTVVRYNEDWSVLKDIPRSEWTDFWDPIKYVPLSEDGGIWASFGGSVRIRSESWWNFAFLPPSVGDDTFVLFQMMAHGDFHFGENLRVFAQGMSALSTDRSLPGGTRTLDVDVLNVEQLFVDFRVPLMEDVSLVIRPGRVEYLFGAQRLVSPLPWANTRRRWDGVTGILDIGDWRVTGWGSRFVPVRKYEPDKADPQQVFYGVYATGPLPKRQNLDLYFLGLNNQDAQTYNGTTGPEDRYTMGGRLHAKYDSGFDYDFEGAYQFGRVNGGGVSAFMIGSQAGYTASGLWSQPRFFVGFDMGSGDHAPGGSVQTFNQLYPLGHAYLGYMDYIGRQNVVGLSFGATCNPLPKLTAYLAGNFFWRDSTADAVYNAGGGVLRSATPPFAPAQTAFSGASEIGQEIDFTLKYQHDRHTQVLLGYSHFFPGDFISQTGPSNSSDFFYAQIQYTF